MAILARDVFTGFVTPPTSGAAPFTVTDNTAVSLWMEFRGTPTTGDQLDYTLTFPTGTVTFRARWTSSTTLVLERVSTIPGTSNGTATLQTFTGASTNKPRSDGDLVRLSITVNRGAADALTAITFAWHGRSAFSTIGTTNTFNVDGEVTPSAGAFAITGTSFRNRPDLQGRAPDEIVAGTWALTLGRAGFEQWGVTSEGIAQPCLPVNEDQAYALTGLSLTSGDMAVRAWAIITAGLAPTLDLMVRWDHATATGFMATVFAPDLVEIGSYTNGVYDGALDSVVVGALDDDTEHEYEFNVVGDTLRFFIDGVEAISVDITGTTILTGTGGLGGLRDSRATSGLDVSAWEIEADAVAPPAPPNPCIGITSDDEFTGDPAADIHLRPTDSFPFQGTWGQHGLSLGLIGVDGAGVARMTGAGRALYLDTGIPGVEEEQCAEARVRFPSVEGAGTPGTIPYFEPWRYRVYAGSSVGGDVLAEGLVEDLVGTQTISGLLIENLTIWPNTQPKTFTIKNTNAFGSGDGQARAIRFFTTGHVAAGVHTYPIVVDWEMTEDPEVQDPPGPAQYMFGNMGGKYLVNNIPESPDTNSIPLGPQNVNPDHPYPPFYFPLGNPATDTRTVTASGSTALVEWTIGGGGQSGQYDVAIAEMELDGSTTWDVGTPGSHVLEHAAVEVLVRHNPATDTCYAFRLDLDHQIGGIVATAALVARNAGVPTVMRSDTVSVAHGVNQTITLRAELEVLVAVHNGEVLFVFDVGTDEADETSALVPSYPTGFPGLAALDDSGTGAYLEIERYTVYSPNAVPCEGGPDNPYPWEPPPPGPSPALEWSGYYRWANGMPRQICHEWLMQHGVHRKVIGPEIPAEEIRRYFQEIGVPRSSLSLCTDFDGDTLPEPDTPFPPFYDPCNLLSPIDPGPVLPLIGRFFGMSAAPPSVMGPLFTGTQIALGGWTPGQLGLFAANGWKLVTGQGNRLRYQLNGQWHKDTFIAQTIAVVGPLYSAIAAYTATSYVGHSFVDDFTSASLWPPSGVPINEMMEALNTLRGQFPGIRWGVRAFPEQFPSNPGFSFYSAQYRYNLGSAFAWAARQYARAASWNAYLILDLNYLHGGNGSSGIRYFNGTDKGQGPNNWFMSAAEVLSYFTDMYQGALSVDSTAQWLIGSKGYQYYPVFLATPGMLDALAGARNQLAMLPPLS